MAKLHFYYSTMNAGKSTALLQSAHNYRERGMTVALFTYWPSALFNKGGMLERPEIVSRVGISSPSKRFDEMTRFLDCYRESPTDCIMIDEAQFLTEDQVNTLCGIVDLQNVPVICYGLRTDFLGAVFPGSSRLLAVADTLTEIKTICGCGRKATMVVRYEPGGWVLRDGPQVEIGGNDRYMSLCRKHWYESISNRRCVFPVEK